MAKVRQLLNPVGVEVAKKSRICHRNRRKHSIAKGERCIVIKDVSTGGKRNYCVECGNEILDVLARDADELRTRLNL